MRRWKRYETMRNALLNLNALQPGDIILTRPRRDFQSRVIAFFAKGRFSHAELFVEGHSTCEATTRDFNGEVVGGVGYNRLTTSFVVTRERPHEPLELATLRDYGHFAVFRHERHDSPLFVQFSARLKETCDKYWLRPYASSEDLRRVSRWPWLVHVFATHSRWFPVSIGRGLFCSMLVAQIYEDGGFRLFTNLPPRDIGPNKLISSKVLRDVTEKIVYTSMPGDFLQPFSDEASFAKINQTLIAGEAAAWSGRDLLYKGHIISKYLGRFNARTAPIAEAQSLTALLFMLRLLLTKANDLKLAQRRELQVQARKLARFKGSLAASYWAKVEWILQHDLSKEKEPHREIAQVTTAILGAEKQILESPKLAGYGTHLNPLFRDIRGLAIQKGILGLNDLPVP